MAKSIQPLHLSCAVLLLALLSGCIPTHSAGQQDATPTGVPAAQSASPEQTGRPPASPLATPFAFEPAAGICADPLEAVFTVSLGGDMPMPRCTRAQPYQRIKVFNAGSGSIVVSIGRFSASLVPGGEHTFPDPLGDFLAPGVHILSVAGMPGSAEIWLQPEQ